MERLRDGLTDDLMANLREYRMEHLKGHLMASWMDHLRDGLMDDLMANLRE
jgi:hypothetical protein